MFGTNRTLWFFPFLFWLILAHPCSAEKAHLVDHYDPIRVDPQLTLAAIIDSTLQKYPDSKMILALEQEASALQKRGNSWLAGAPSAFFYYFDDVFGGDTGAREMEGAIELPLWNWGQRDAGQNVAEQAKLSSSLQAKVIKLQVAGLVRHALWDLSLENNRHKMAKQVFAVAEKLTQTVQRRVELGDLPKADLLLAQSELLEKRSKLVNTEAEIMHARKRYSTLTQTHSIPVQISETLSLIVDISYEHPVLLALNAVIERKNAELKWVKAAGSGQTKFSLGGRSDRGEFEADGISGMSFNINVPFGGSAHLAPDIAAANLALTEAVAERDRLYRQLTEVFHEAQHALEVDEAALEIAKQRKKIAEAHLQMTQLSFAAGEINLMDLLKIQAKSYAAIQDASERTILLQRDIALYNQAVGVLP